MNIETFSFNPYRECTYVLVNDHKQAVIIDAGMYETREQQRFAQYIQDISFQNCFRIGGCNFELYCAFFRQDDQKIHYTQFE